jgi:hypothetical protein
MMADSDKNKHGDYFCPKCPKQGSGAVPSSPQAGSLDSRFDNLRRFARDNFVAHDDIRMRFDMLVDQLRIDSQKESAQLPAGKYACNPEHPFGIPSHPASATCKDCNASHCCAIWNCPLRNEIVKMAKGNVLDALMGDLESLPSSTDSQNIVWITMRDVQEKIDERKEEVSRSYILASTSAPGIRRTSELPRIIPPLPEGDTKDLKTWREYWRQHDSNTRTDAINETLDKLRAYVESTMFTDISERKSDEWVRGKFQYAGKVILAIESLRQPQGGP